MEGNWSEQLMNVINQIAGKLGVATEKIYPVLRKQALINGIVDLFWIVASIIVIYFSAKISVKLSKKIDNGEFNDDVGIPIVVLLCILVIAFGFGFVIHVISIKDTMTALINPDWYIINNILKQLVR